MLTVGEISQFFFSSSFILSLVSLSSVIWKCPFHFGQHFVSSPFHFATHTCYFFPLPLKGTKDMTSLNMVLFQHGFHLISHLWWFMMESSPGFRNNLSFPIPTQKTEGFPQWTACSSVQVQSSHSVTSTAEISLNAEALLWRSGSCWNSIRLSHTNHGQIWKAEVFWVEELNYEDSSGDHTLEELAVFALSLLDDV